MRFSLSTLTVSSEATFDLKNGGTAAGFFGGLYGAASSIVLESGATVARVESYANAIFGGSAPTMTTKFFADAAGSVTTFQIDNNANVVNTILELDLSAVTDKLGTYVLYDYGTIINSFLSDDVISLDIGQSYSVNTAYDIGGGDLGVAGYGCARAKHLRFAGWLYRLVFGRRAATSRLVFLGRLRSFLKTESRVTPAIT